MALSHPGVEINHNKTAHQRFYLPRELARLAGVSTDTLRYYERKGVLPKPMRLRNGYRQYSNVTLERLRIIRGALSIGFTVDELAEIFRERSCGGIPCARVRDLAKEKLVEMETRLREIREIRKDLSLLLKEWDLRLSKTRKGEQAHLLESMPGSLARTERSRTGFFLTRAKKKS